MAAQINHVARTTKVTPTSLPWVGRAVKVLYYTLLIDATFAILEVLHHSFSLYLEADNGARSGNPVGKGDEGLLAEK